MAHHSSRFKHRIALISLATTTIACSGAPSHPDGHSMAAKSDAVSVATTWASSCTVSQTRTAACRVDNNQELASMIESWEDSQVLRVFNDGQAFKAVVANGLSDELRQAVILTITNAEGSWAVISVELGQTDLLWPGY